MTVFYLKLLITPLLMLSISLAARRWGTHIGGLLSGLPVTSSVVMLFLSLEQGPGFVALAVPGALAGLAAIQATYLFYLSVTRRLSALLGCLAALGFQDHPPLLAIYALVIIASKAGNEFDFKKVLVLATVLAVGSYVAFIWALKLQIQVWPTFITG